VPLMKPGDSNFGQNWKPGTGHPDTQAIFTSVASFNALTKSDTIPQVSRPFPLKSRFLPIPEHTTVIRQYYFRFERNNAVNAIDGEPCICIE
jgi:hypothetical protein